MIGTILLILGLLNQPEVTQPAETPRWEMAPQSNPTYRWNA